jgi:uncharacterized protein (DUF2336 family)
MESASLSNLIHLTRLGPRGGVDMRPTLLRVLTDLYVQKLTHTPDEEQHYTELALRLLDAVDVPTRAAVAGRLVRHLSPPPRVIDKLAADLPEIATAMRARPPVNRKPPSSEPPLQPVAPIAPAVQVQIRETEDQPQAPASAPLPDTITPDVAGELNELFFAANADERRLILLNLEIAVPMPSGRTPLARDAAVGRQLEAAALARNREDFAQTLARSLQIPAAQARRIAGDELGESIVIVAKALAMPRDVVYRILLFVNTTVGHSVERVHTLATLYDEMTAQAAEHMVAIWQALQRNEQPAAGHRPLHWNDEARARTRTATAAVRRAPAAQRGGDRRSAS